MLIHVPLFGLFWPIGDYWRSSPQASRGIAPLVWAPLVATASIRTLAAGPEEAGFCPVISNPSVTT